LNERHVKNFRVVLIFLLFSLIVIFFDCLVVAMALNRKQMSWNNNFIQ